MAKANKRSVNNLAGPLRQASAGGNLPRVRELLGQGADPNKRATGLPTPLIAAASAGHSAVVKQLIAAGAEVNFAHGGKQGTTALLEAIRKNQFETAKILAAAGADVRFDASGIGRTITDEAARKCNDLFKSRLSKDNSRAPACLRLLRALISAGGKAGPGPLRNAAAFGNVEMVRLLLKSGADVNELDQGLSVVASAVLFGQEELAVELLRLGADPWLDESEIKPFPPPLHHAVIAGLKKVVQGFIEVKAGLDGLGEIAVGPPPPETLIEDKDDRGKVIGRAWKFHPPPKAREATAIIVAVQIGNHDMVRLLARGGANLEIADADGFTPLAWAIKYGHKDIASTLRKAGAKEPKHLHGSPQHALWSGAASGDLQVVRMALSDGAKVNQPHEFERELFSPLHKASATGHTEIVAELLMAGADPNLTGRDAELNAGLTPLMLASRGGHKETARLLLEAGAKVEPQQVNLLGLVFGDKAERGRPNDAAIHEAASHGHEDIMKMLFAAGASVKDKSGASGTVLDAAAASGNLATIEVALKAAGKGKSKGSVSASNLLSAVESGDVDAVRRLIEAGADVNAKTRRGHTAVSGAAAAGNLKILKLLREAGGKCAAGQGTVYLAASTGDVEILEELLAMGGNVNERYSDETPLHAAVSGGQPEAVTWLLEKGASPAALNDERKTPLQLARQIIRAWSGKNKHPLIGELPNMAGYKKCAAILEEAGA